MRYHNTDSLLSLIREYAAEVPSGLHMAVAGVCPEPELLNVYSADALRETFRGFKVFHKASTPSDDDEHWIIYNPWDRLYYHFASAPCAGFPTKAVGHSERFPDDWFNDAY